MAELVTNGGFDSDSVWTKETGWSIIEENKVAQFSRQVAYKSSLYQAVAITPGGVYQLTYAILGNTGGILITPYLGGLEGKTRGGSPTGTFVEFLVAGVLDNLLLFLGRSDDNGGYMYIDNVSLVEVPQVDLLAKKFRRKFCYD